MRSPCHPLDTLETERREQRGTQSRPTHGRRPLYSTWEASRRGESIAERQLTTGEEIQGYKDKTTGWGWKHRARAGLRGWWYLNMRESGT